MLVSFAFWTKFSSKHVAALAFLSPMEHNAMFFHAMVDREFHLALRLQNTRLIPAGALMCVCSYCDGVLTS